MGDVGYSNGRPEAGRSPERLDPVAAERSRLVEEATRAVVKLVRVHGEADIIGAAPSVHQETDANPAKVEQTLASVAIRGTAEELGTRTLTKSEYTLAS